MGIFFFRVLQFIKKFQDLHKLRPKSSKKVLNRISYLLYTSYEWYIILTQFISKDIKNMYLPWIHVRFFLIRISQKIAPYNRDCMKIKFTLETLHFTFILFSKSYFHIHLLWILLHSRICSQHFWLRLQHRLHCFDKCCPHRGC